MSRIHSQTEARRYFIGGSDAQVIIGQDEAALHRLWREKREVKPEDLSGDLIVHLRPATEDLNRRWYERITGRMPVGWYIAAFCYATAVILVGWWPWNILLILLLTLPVLPSGNHNTLRFGVFVAPKESARSKLFCLRGGSL